MTRPFRHPTVLALLALLVSLACSAPSPRAPQSEVRGEFVASSRGQVYYWTGCEAWGSLSPVNLRFFQSADEAEAAGYRPSGAPGCAPQLATESIEPAVGGSATCVVSRIVDGDTFDCQGGSRIRLLLVDTDEQNQSAFADSATALLSRLAAPGSEVRLEFDVALRDRYDRLLAYVYKDGVFVNRELARRGLAHALVLPPNVREVTTIRAASDSARAERIGVWSGSAFECTPVDFRNGRCP